MLRSLVALLLLANLLWWAGHSPATAEALGLPLAADREPQRLTRQIEAERITLVTPPGAPAPRPVPATATAPGAATGSATSASAASAATLAASPADASPICLEAGPLTELALAQARRELLQAGASPDAWVDMRREVPGSLAIYMGRFADAEQARRKGEELQRLAIPHELAQGELAPGLLLGRYTSNEQANAGLQRLQSRGVRTARLVTLVAPSAEHQLRLDRADAGLQARLQTPVPGATPPRILWRACAR